MRHIFKLSQTSLLPGKQMTTVLDCSNHRLSRRLSCLISEKIPWNLSHPSRLHGMSGPVDEIYRPPAARPKTDRADTRSSRLGYSISLTNAGPLSLTRSILWKCHSNLSTRYLIAIKSNSSKAIGGLIPRDQRDVVDWRINCHVIF